MEQSECFHSAMFLALGDWSPGLRALQTETSAPMETLGQMERDASVPRGTLGTECIRRKVGEKSVPRGTQSRNPE